MSIDYLKIQQEEREDHQKIMEQRLKTIEKGMSPIRVSNYHKDSGKSKTKILLNHLKKENLERTFLVNDKNLMKRLKKLIK